jgi:hypothetical protein
MGIFDQKPKKKTEVRGGNTLLSTPFGKVGKGDISLPYINEVVYGRGGIVYFGADNMYPQLLDQMYISSPIHAACIDMISLSVIGGGIKFDTSTLSIDEQVKLSAFIQRCNLSKVMDAFVKSYVVHRRAHIKVKVKKSEILQITPIPSAYIRKSKDGRYWYNEDWRTGMVARNLEPYLPGCKDGEYIMSLEEPSLSGYVYAIPSYTSALNWVFLDHEQSTFHKSNIQNSIYPSIAIAFPNEFKTIEERNKKINEITNMRGAEGAGNIIILTGYGSENIPTVTSLSTNQNDKLFETTSREVKDQICFAHKINPSVIGVKVAGSLGNREELEMSFAIMQKIVTKPIQDDCKIFLRHLLLCAGFAVKFDIEDFDILGTKTVV